MSWLKGLAAVGLLVALQACGFRPLYGDHGVARSVADDLAQIQVAVIADRPGQVLRNHLIQRFNPSGRPGDPLYRLDVRLVEERQDLGIQKDETATRANLIQNAYFMLTELGSETVVVNSRVGAITSYNILVDQVATLTNERDARERALRQISDDIRIAIALYFDRAG